jgi:hypothetical protein
LEEEGALSSSAFWSKKEEARRGGELELPGRDPTPPSS